MSYLSTHTAIIGTSGMGKTVTAKGHVESLLDDHRHLCVIDPTGAWYGLRSNASGDGPGFDIPIFGGDHGDVAITRDQGGAVGGYIAGGVSAIVDLSDMDSRDQRMFMLAFMRALRKKPRGTFHLVIDEADEFAPQTAPDNTGFELVEQLTWVAKRGRLSGFVMTAITQRPADIAKSVLTQMQTIIAHGLVAPQDQKPIDDYLKGHGDTATRKQVMGSLAGLGIGERWIYSPRLRILDRGFSPMPLTFDSSRTPEPGELPAEPKMLASIDLGAIRKALYIGGADQESACVKEMQVSGDISAEIGQLKSRIAELEVAEQEWFFERATGQQQLDALGSQNKAYRILLDTIAGAISDFQRIEPAGDPDLATGCADDALLGTAEQWLEAIKPKPARQSQEPREGPVELNAAARKMLEMLDRIAPARVPWGSLAAMIGNKARGGNFNSARKAMRESGLIIEDGDTVRSAAQPTQSMSSDEAFDLWCSVLSNPAPRMMEALRQTGDGSTKADIGQMLGIVPRGGNFNNGIAQLIRNGVAIDRGGVLHLADPLPGESK
jgi:hypothetical protein